MLNPFYKGRYCQQSKNHKHVRQQSLDTIHFCYYDYNVFGQHKKNKNAVFAYDPISYH